MIFYFTRTGNSHWVAEALGMAFDEPLVPITDALNEGKDENVYPLRRREEVFLVSPIHSWESVVLVPRFISRLVLPEYKGQEAYFVCICDDDCGYMDRIMRSALARRGITLIGGFSMQVPNSYILMPGPDVDSKEVETEELKKAPERVDEIVEAIRQKKNPLSYCAGGASLPKSYTVYLLFAHFTIGNNRFYAMDACVSCGICMKVCPTGTILLSGDGEPKWAGTCVQCVACIHHCPVRAIEYGTISLKKGRYHYPEFK